MLSRKQANRRLARDVRVARQGKVQRRSKVKPLRFRKQKCLDQSARLSAVESSSRRSAAADQVYSSKPYDLQLELEAATCTQSCSNARSKRPLGGLWLNPTSRVRFARGAHMTFQAHLEPGASRAGVGPHRACCGPMRTTASAASSTRLPLMTELGFT